VPITAAIMVAILRHGWRRGKGHAEHKRGATGQKFQSHWASPLQALR
jgi:hypothetical protein